MGSQKKILIIDDEPDFVDMLKQWLNFQGYDVLEATQGEEGLEVAQENRPDLILLDVTMPIMNGHKCWSLLKRSPDLNKIPVLILSAQPQATDMYWKLSLPVEDYLLKSTITKKLAKRINEKLEGTLVH